MSGRLLLVPNGLDLGAEDAPPIDQVLSLGVLREAAVLRHWVVENAKSTRAFLKRVAAVVPLGHPLQSLQIDELPRPVKGSANRQTAAPEDLASLLAPARSGHDIGLLSEAGLPGVADPGAALVQQAHRLGLPVVALPGPSALVLALAASGLNGQRFAFAGYLPTEPAERATRLRALEQQSRQWQQTQLFIETPYRNTALLQAALEILAPTTWLSISCGLTLPNGFTRSDRVAGWRQHDSVLPNHTPAVFSMLAA